MAKNEESLSFLLSLYQKREDLQDSFPEVESKDYQALINWAAGVSSKRWIDSDNETLSVYREWYEKHEKSVQRPKNTDLIRNILKLSKFPMNHTLNKILDESDIGEHLPTLYFLTVEFNLKRTLELGVRDGISTIALVEGASKIDGHVWSIDIDKCSNARNEISSLNLDKYWSFIQGNDIEIGSSWDKQLDHIFIDTSHLYKYTIQELRLFSKFLVPGGFITLHDTRSFPGVLKAVEEFVKIENGAYSFYNYFNNNGFSILRKSQ